MTNWYYKNKIVKEIPEGIIGFVYLITNLTNDKKYIGKKLAQFKRSKPPLEGRKNKRRTLVESDWRDYYGSSDELNEDVEKLGKENLNVRYFISVQVKQNYLMQKQENNSNTKYQRQMIGITGTFE